MNKKTTGNQPGSKQSNAAAQNVETMAITRVVVESRGATNANRRLTPLNTPQMNGANIVT